MKLERPPDVKYIDYFGQALQDKYKTYLLSTDERYLYWDDIKYKKNGPFENPLENWSLIKAYRYLKSETIIFGHHWFRYYISHDTAKNLHDFDLKLIGDLHKAPMLANEKMEFFKNSLMEEAVASSQVEGAATTTEVAKDMLKSGRSPRNESEQMILNNLRAINYIHEFKDKDIDFKIVIELHSIMTANTDAESCSGAFRSGDVFVTDHVDGEIAHTPPDASHLNSLMQDLCSFINDDSYFIHPIVKASIIHFMIGYIHPFSDGNGRTARALFYWFLLRKGYTLISDISISRVILESRTQYDKAFLKTEYDENDINYFIAYSIKNIRIAFEKLSKYRDKKLEERKKANNIAYEFLNLGFNKRQSDLLGYLYSKPKNRITLNNYSEKNDIVRQTANRDLKELIKNNLIKEDSSSKPYKYSITDRKILEEYLSNNTSLNT